MFDVWRSGRHAVKRGGHTLARRSACYRPVVEALEPRLAPAIAFVSVIDTDGGESAKASSVALDTAGNIYVAGTFTSTVDFDPGPGVTALTSNAGNAYVAKYAANGTLVWAKNFGGWYVEAPRIALDPHG